MTARRFIAPTLGLLLAVQIGRIAWIERLGGRAPAVAAPVWPGHPDITLNAGMLEIATAAREGRAVAPSTLTRMYAASSKAPLADEPFLVRGVQAQIAGDGAAAEQAFLAAERRNPRSLPARYFLADYYLHQGDARKGLREVGALSRLAPGGAAQLAPHVATFARSRANWPHVRALFRLDPELAKATLAALATDARNVDTVLALAGTQPSAGESPWLSNLLASLIKAEQFARARAVWARASRVRLDPATLLYDPDFRRADAPAPFNWSLTSSSVGLAERGRGGGLNLIFYGQQDGVLASQLLVLPPGRYRLSMRAAAAPAGMAMLHWTLVCAPSNAEIAAAPMQSAAARPWLFAVPAGCPAQRLELAGRASDLPQQRVDVTILGLRLEREQGRG